MRRFLPSLSIALLLFVMPFLPSSAMAGELAPLHRPTAPVSPDTPLPPPAKRPSTEAVAAVPGVGPGVICDDPALVGEPLAPVRDEDCGIAAPILVTQASGIKLDPPARLDCAAARPLAIWLRRGAQASFVRQGAYVEAVAVADSYSCRNRNRATTGKRSEHAYGRAIDIAAFRLRDGRTVTVREGWVAAAWGPVLHRIHDAGCGPFATVLGPEADAMHVDHLHLDAASRKHGAFCQ